MKKSQSLKGRKFNIIIPKSSQNISEKYESKNSSEIIIKTLAQLPNLHLPIKKVPHAHITYKKQKNPKINTITLEKLKLVVLNLKMRKKEKNKKEKSKNKKYVTSSSPVKNKISNKNNNKLFKKNKKNNNKDNDLLISNNNDFNINCNPEKNAKLNKTSEININRSNSLEADIYPNFDALQFRNKDKNKKWYNNIEFLTEKYNELILTTENLEKNIMSKYLDGTDNIISEIEEPQFLKEDIDIKTMNINASLRKHLSIRETTLDSSYHNSNNNTDKMKAKANGFILKIKNYRKMFRKYRTNFMIKSRKENMNKNKVRFHNDYNEQNQYLNNRKKNKRKKKLPIFSKSLSKIKHSHNDYSEKTINQNNINISNNENLNIRNISFDKESKDSFFSLNEIKKKYRSSSSYCKYEKNQIFNVGMENRNPSLAIIKETNDNINIENKDNYKNRKQSAKITYDINKSKIKNKVRDNSPKGKNIHSSEKSLQNYRPKYLSIKNKKYLNNKNSYSFYINDEYFKSFKGISKSCISDYDISIDLGIGSYAEVKLGIHKITNKKYAIKIYDKCLINDEEKKYTIKNEIFILQQLNNENDNIMKLYDVINTNRYLYLILEYIDGISLLEFIQRDKKRRIEENICKDIFYQIVKAILYCQKKNICHRDIKLENILIINNNIIKLIDFGFAVKCKRNEYQDFYCGTLYYMPPEIVNKQKYIPFYSDIWSLGVLLYTMLFGNFPFKSKKESELFELINKAKLDFPDDIEVSEEVKNLLFKIIVIKPTKRISLEDILNDPWFKNSS